MEEPGAEDPAPVGALRPDGVEHDVVGVQAQQHVGKNRVIKYPLQVLDFSDECSARISAHGEALPGIDLHKSSEKWTVAQIVLGIVASMIVAYFSRRREFRADAASAQLMGGSRPMINALARLGGLEPGELPAQVKSMGITSSPSGMMALFSSHPPIEQRIAALQASGR